MDPVNGVFQMTSIGKSVRIERIKNRKTGRIIIVPMDHGVSSGPIRGLTDMPKIVNKVADGGANAVLLHKGIIRVGHRGYGKDIGLIMHLSASTSLAPDPDNKVLTASVEEAIKLGADVVSVHINIGAENEADMLEILGEISEECMEWGMPLLAMMYPRGRKVDEMGGEHNVEVVKHAARVGAELGADIIKTNYTGDPDSFREVTKGCPVPVVIAGGPKMDTPKDVLQMIRDAIDAGGIGTSIGRNVFQAEEPIKMVRAMARIVHDGYEADEAIKELN